MTVTWLFLVVIVAMAVTGFAKRFDLQVPLVLVAIGGAVSFIPGLPRLELSPELMLGVVLPPLLYSAALDFSFSTFRRNLAPILRLGIGMVVVTTFAVGWFANWLVPELTLGAALVLGAVVAPPDAVAAVAVGRKLGLPRRMMAILKGESLVNDAAALTLFALATAAVTGRKIAIGSPVLYFLYEVVGGVVVGLVLSFAVRFVRARIADPPMETVLGLLLPFAAYFAAEEIHASGVLAVVTAGFVLGRDVGDESVSTRLQESAVWPTIDLVMETFVFAYMGLQLRFVIEDVRDEGLPVHHIFAYGLAILALVILIRPMWIFATQARSEGWRQNLVISWAGMRGVVTLAAASGVPLTTLAGDPFPGRGVIVAVAFTVAVGTLLIQGLTLPLLIRRLDVADPDEDRRQGEQMMLARRISHDAAAQFLEEALRDPPAGMPTAELSALVQRVQRVSEARANVDRAEEVSDHEAKTLRASAVFNRLRRGVLQDQRAALIAARNAGELDDEVLRYVLDGLDIEEVAAESRVRRSRW
ncbi:sodium/proton antiporter (CPA1 family) [Rhodococcus sp. OK611]|uniref:Na+/H+ antiporter n=1 Tax=unclassified Rhodococcus (in: high G+C Gram-positive bacteria) TaxID=192944 RepID=UPI000BC5A2CB|nr:MULTISPECIES: Na+/H+ antiporter [unclassified Rhodococcus (in: high G+C Gram-positive bacteria)]PTR36873.1 sodium/proton antiporter (CPA1 family) [Rhodococcus sp. OK611]SNX93604.1 sodium/proton antiporter, CPA1 family [Rhodococcus sp. OK270]